jgi:hypothetical protein
MLILEPGYEEICDWICGWVRSELGSKQRGAA